MRFRKKEEITRAVELLGLSILSIEQILDKIGGLSLSFPENKEEILKYRDTIRENLQEFKHYLGNNVVGS